MSKEDEKSVPQEWINKIHSMSKHKTGERGLVITSPVPLRNTTSDGYGSEEIGEMSFIIASQGNASGLEDGLYLWTTLKDGDPRFNNPFFLQSIGTQATSLLDEKLFSHPLQISIRGARENGDVVFRLLPGAQQVII